MVIRRRGGSPIAADLVLATEFGGAATDLLMAGKNGRLAVVQPGRIAHILLTDAKGK